MRDSMKREFGFLRYVYLARFGEECQFNIPFLEIDFSIDLHRVNR